MDAQDHTTHTTPSGHHGHGFYLCHRCGWPYPNPHPSARHRRAHKKICGTVDGYTTLTEVVSDDEYHQDDDDKENTPSPKIDKKTSIDSNVGDGEIRGSFFRSEDEMFTDAVTEFADSGISTGSANKTLDRDLFFSYKDAENAGTNVVLNAPIETSKVDTNTEVSEKSDPHVEKIEETVGDSSDSNLELTITSGLVKDGVVGQESQTSETNYVMETGEEKGQESQTSETITEEAFNIEITKTTTEVSAVVGGGLDNVKQENFEKLESLTTDGISKEIKQEIKSECEHVSEVLKESEAVEEVKIAKLELDHEIAPEVVKGSEIDPTVSVLNEKVDLGAPSEQTQEFLNEPVAVLTENKDLEEPELEKSSSEQILESVKEPVPVLIEKEDLGESQLEKQSIEHTHEVVEKPDAIFNEKDLAAPELEGSSKEQIQEVAKEPDTVLTEKEDLGGPHLIKQSNEHIHEVAEKSGSTLTEKQDLGAPKSEKCTKENIVEEPDSVLTEKEVLDAHKPEKYSENDVVEQKVNDCNLVADVSTETSTLKGSSDNPVTNNKNASDVPEPIVEEGDGKLMNNQDSGADVAVDSSSHNSLEGTWGSVSVLSADAESLQLNEKSKVNSEKSNAAATSDVFEPPSFMTLVKPESKDKKLVPSEGQDSQPQPNSEDSQAGWFPTLTNVSNESEGRKRNEEAMAKVTNWSAGKQSTPLKNLLGEGRSPSGKQPEPVVQKDEATVNPLVNDDTSSPPKLIEDDKKAKKVKGRSLWIPFVCCSSVNAVK